MSLTPGNTTAPIPLFSFDLPLPPRPDNPAPRGLRFPGNPDPRPYITDKEKSAFCKSPKELEIQCEIKHFIKGYTNTCFSLILIR